MTEADRSGGRWWRAAGPLLVIALAACTTSPTATPPPSSNGTSSPSPTATVPATASVSVRPTASPAPTATPLPALTLELPESRDARQVRVEIAPEIPADAGGRLVVAVTNLSAERVVELVLRWPTDLREALFLAPFEPSEQRIADGGPPLLQDWTKWVEGPGERGEPEGTTSLGWGPLDPGATLTIPIVVSRRAAGPVAFDLQILAGEAVMSAADGQPAAFRVEIP